ncbi:ETX/MTX2 family pore-forming toxin [Bacillus cereus]|uniref:Uncharacterized protein n=1 Tax=Bacillus cereus TaxID=1396 RepID=A0A2B9ECJ6_BACCE|nr:ETX/MTX2 family pore-forming toxin [Bacillus cereus]PGM97547.1 hypothetical protein CN958_02250 [Bacillus cereus]
MKTCSNQNEVNPRALTLFDLDQYLDGIVKNVKINPVALVDVYDGYKPSGSWRFSERYIPTPTSGQIPNACTPSGSYKAWCNFEPYNGTTWTVDTSGLVAGGVDVYQQINSVPLQTPIIADRHEYRNTSSLQQAYVSPSYSESVTTTTTNTTTNGCKFNTKASYSKKSKYKVAIRDIERGFNLEVGAEYNFSNTQTTTASTIRTVTFPSFTTQVPPRTTAIVSIILNRGYYVNYNVPVEVDLFGRFMSHHINYTNDWRTFQYYDLYPFVELNQTCCSSTCNACAPKEIRALPNNSTVRFNGTGTFIADVASNNFVVTTSFIDNDTGATVAEQVEYVPAIYEGPATQTVTTS